MLRVLSLLLMLAAAVAAVSAPGANERVPALRLVDKSPITLRGSAFKARERVTVTATDGTARVVRVVRAGSSGTFAVTFPKLRFDPCELEARASGARGSRAWFKLPERMCPIPLAQS